MNSDPDQLKAIHHLSGPALVIAGPGSGKTLVLTSRVHYLITRGVLPRNILVLTFSKAAANEMKDRYLQISRQTSTEVLFGTFHSVFYQFLKSYRHSIPKLLSDHEKTVILRRIIRRLNLRVPETEEYFGLLIRRISLIKCGKSMEIIEDDPCFSKIYPLYVKETKAQDVMDFEDLLIQTSDMLCSNPEILRKLQERFLYVFVDEFQDIDPVQYEILMYLCDESRNLFAVGDDDQCIYSFRGSDPSYMRRLKADFEDLKTYPLWNNYRCDKSITEASLRLIRHNRERLQKEIVSMSGNRGCFVKQIFPGYEEEYKAVIKILKNSSPKERANTAILLRNNRIHNLFLKLLKDNHIPYVIDGKRESITENAHVRNLLAYFHLCDSAFDCEDFVRIMNRPYRGFHAYDIPKEELSFPKLEYIFRNDPDLSSELMKLKQQIRILKDLDPFGKLMYVTKTMGLSCEDELFAYLAEEARKYPDCKEWETALMKETRNVIGDSAIDSTAVRIMTMHASKGLEFERVIVPDVNEGIIPANASIQGNQMEEERRLMYVAMTRAKRKLYLFAVNSANAYKKTERMIPSRFFKEI